MKTDDYEMMTCKAAHPWLEGLPPRQPSARLWDHACPWENPEPPAYAARLAAA
jgi:hypothetical protein